MPLLDLVQEYLEANGAVSSGWVFYRSRMPDDDPNQRVISVDETYGYAPTEINRDTENLSFQLRVRGPAFSYDETRAKWYECKTLLKDSQEGGGLLTGIVFIQVITDGMVHWVDTRNRDNFVTNFRVKKYPDEE